MPPPPLSAPVLRSPTPPERLQPVPGVTAAPASRLTSASESTQAMLETTLNSIIATESLHPLFMENREADLPRQSQSSPNRSGFLSFHFFFPGNKAAGTNASGAVFMSRTIFLRLPLLSRAFHKHACSLSALRRSCLLKAHCRGSLISDSLLVQAGSICGNGPGLFWGGT